MNDHNAFPRSFRRACAPVLAGVALSCIFLGAAAQEPPSAPQSTDVQVAANMLARIEEAFWMCDHSANRRTMDRYQAAICGGVIDGVRTEKFGGDIEKLLRWWEQNHAVQHRKLDERDAHAELPLP